MAAEAVRGAQAAIAGAWDQLASGVSSALKHKDAPAYVAGGLAAYGLYNFLASSAPVERVGDVTWTGTAPPGADEGGSAALPREPLPVAEDVSVEQVPDLVATMRENFFKGTSRSFASRIRNLDGIIRFFEENEAAILAALHEDLGRPEFEAVVYDVLVPLADIKHLRANLSSYMTPERKGFSLASFPASAALYPEPFGVALIVDTWNYPIMLGVLPLAGAIAAGNTAILKPSVVSRATARLLGELLPKYLDPDVARVVGHTADRDRHMLTALLEAKTDKVFFTGSPKVGRIVAQAAAKHLTPCTLELGGKNPVLVDADADLALAAKRVVWGRCMNGGQQCISPDYVLVHKSVVQEFTAACKAAIEQFYEGNPKQSACLGRIVDATRMQAQVDILERHSGTVVVGGDVDVPQRYVAPTVLHLDLHDPVMEGETFGPILMVAAVDSMEQACAYVAAKPKPLSMYIFTPRTATQEYILQNTSAGGVTINGTLWHVSHPELPFGGVGASGMGGGYHGKATFDCFTHYKPVLRKTALPDGGLLSDLWLVYPPWDSTKLSLARLLL